MCHGVQTFRFGMESKPLGLDEDIMESKPLGLDEPKRQA
jgi:hypothetical protein